MRPPFNVNLLGQIAALVSLKDKAQVTRGVSLAQKGKKYFYSQLFKMKIPCVPSAANFVLIDVNPFKGRDIFKELLKKGIIVRSMDEYDLPNFIRVTVGTDEQNRSFFKALSEVMKKPEAE